MEDNYFGGDNQFLSGVKEIYDDSYENDHEMYGDICESEGDLKSSHLSEDFVDEEQIQVSLAQGCVKKIGDDMNKLHSHQVRVCKGVQEVFDDMEDEIKVITEWKANAKVKIGNYKIVIEELMRQLEALKNEKEEEIEILEKKLEESQNENKKILTDFNYNEKEWERAENEMEREREELRMEVKIKETEFQRERLSLEGDIEDLRRGYTALETEKHNLDILWKKKFDAMKKIEREDTAKG